MELLDRIIAKVAALVDGEEAEDDGDITIEKRHRGGRRRGRSRGRRGRSRSRGRGRGRRIPRGRGRRSAARSRTQASRRAASRRSSWRSRRRASQLRARRRVEQARLRNMQEQQARAANSISTLTPEMMAQFLNDPRTQAALAQRDQGSGVSWVDVLEVAILLTPMGRAAKTLGLTGQLAARFKLLGLAGKAGSATDLIQRWLVDQKQPSEEQPQAEALPPPPQPSEGGNPEWQLNSIEELLEEIGELIDLIQEDEDEGELEDEYFDEDDLEDEDLREGDEPGNEYLDEDDLNEDEDLLDGDEDEYLDEDGLEDIMEDLDEIMDGQEAIQEGLDELMEEEDEYSDEEESGMVEPIELVIGDSTIAEGGEVKRTNVTPDPLRASKKELKKQAPGLLPGASGQTPGIPGQVPTSSSSQVSEINELLAKIAGLLGSIKTPDDLALPRTQSRGVEQTPGLFVEPRPKLGTKPEPSLGFDRPSIEPNLVPAQGFPEEEKYQFRGR